MSSHLCHHLGDVISRVVATDCAVRENAVCPLRLTLSNPMDPSNCLRLKIEIQGRPSQDDNIATGIGIQHRATAVVRRG